MDCDFRPAASSAPGSSFDEVVLPHLGAARRLARWLMRNEHDAEDVVQEAALRAFRYFRTFGGGDGRAWFLRIVRNICLDWHGQRIAAPTDSFDEKRHPGGHDASDPELPGRYDLVTIFEALHDMNHPVEALRTARKSLAEGGSVVIADERVAERFIAPGDELERVNYGWSVLHCLAVGLLDADSAGTGTVLRPKTLRAYASEGRDLIDGFPAGGEPTSGRGQVLAPWPNRLEDGAYEFDGRRHELPLTEPERGNAIHGLVRSEPWTVARRTPDSVELEHVLVEAPRPFDVLDGERRVVCAQNDRHEAPP